MVFFVLFCFRRRNCVFSRRRPENPETLFAALWNKPGTFSEKGAARRHWSDFFASCAIAARYSLFAPHPTKNVSFRFFEKAAGEQRFPKKFVYEKISLYIIRSGRDSHVLPSRHLSLSALCARISRETRADGRPASPVRRAAARLFLFRPLRSVRIGNGTCRQKIPRAVFPKGYV